MYVRVFYLRTSNRTRRALLSVSHARLCCVWRLCPLADILLERTSITLKRRWAELAHSPSRQLIELVDHRALLLIIHPAVEDGQQREG